MKQKSLKVCVAALAVLVLLPQARVAATPRQRDAATEQEAREARELALVFTERLLKTRDLSSIVRELYVEDFMRRQLEELSVSRGGGEPDDFMLDGIPALSFKRALLAHPEHEYWTRLYVAAHTFLHFGMLSALSKDGPPDVSEQGVRAMYPPEAVRLLGTNPTLANFLVKRGDYVDVSTLEELRAVTETLEEAVRLTRAHLDKHLPLKLPKLEAALAELRREPQALPVEPFPVEGGFMGFPPGTRFTSVLTPIGLNLVAARHDGKLKIVMSHLPAK